MNKGREHPRPRSLGRTHSAVEIGRHLAQPRADFDRVFERFKPG
jgi:hypothetical protein